MQALARSLAASLEGASAPCPGAGGGGVPVPAATSGASTPAPGGSEIEDDPIAQAFAELLGTDGPPPDLLDTLLGSIAVLGGSVAVAAVSMVEAGRSVGDARSAWAANGAKGIVGLTDLGRTTTIELSGDEARRVLAAQKGDVIEIPADERWGTIVSGGGRTERDDFLGTHGRIRGIGARVESADDIVISVDVDLVAPADATGGGIAAAAAGTVAPELGSGTEATVADSEPSAPESEPAAESPAEPLRAADEPVSSAPPSPEPAPANPTEPAPPTEPESGAVAAAAGHPGPGEAAVSAAASSVATPPTPVERVRTAIAKQLGPDGTTVTGPIFDRVDALLAAGGGPFTLSADEFANLAGLDPEGRIEGVQLNDGHIVVRPTGAGIDVPIRPTVHRATGQVGFSLGATDIQELLLDAPVKAIATKLGVDIEGTTRGLNNLIDSTGLRVTGIRVAPDGIHIETVRGDPPDH
jgi:hypothetical protein